MKLSRNFNLSEFTNSTAARINNINNDPPPHIMAILATTASRMEDVRALLGNHRFTITSGYRSPKLNKAIGGAPNSQHMTGHAVDFICPEFGSPADIVAKIKHSEIPYDQVICEYYSKDKPNSGWVHISFTAQPRGQALWIDETGTRAFA